MSIFIIMKTYSLLKKPYKTQKKWLILCLQNIKPVNLWCIIYILGVFKINIKYFSPKARMKFQFNDAWFSAAIDHSPHSPPFKLSEFHLLPPRYPNCIQPACAFFISIDEWNQLACSFPILPERISEFFDQNSLLDPYSVFLNFVGFFATGEE